MSAQALLDRLSGVRQNGPGKWMAKCPAHDDNDPSLSVRLAEDGKILLKCFAGCNSLAIVAAIGLEISDLFPPGTGKPQDHRRRYQPRDDEILHAELLIAIARADRERGIEPSEADKTKINRALDLLRRQGRHG